MQKNVLFFAKNFPVAAFTSLEFASCERSSKKNLHFLSPSGDFVRHICKKRAARCGLPQKGSADFLVRAM
jgi:hypothetical protein